MATATDSQLDVELTVTETAPCTKQIRLRVPASAVNARVDMAMATFMADASLPGFRKGKAPKALLEKRFGPAIVQETRQQVMSEAYSRAVDEHKLRPITDPRPVAGETVPELARGSDFAFSVEIEVAPEFDLPDFGGFEVHAEFRGFASALRRARPAC